MPETIEDFLMTRPPTVDRPLLGLTVLVVEDSRFACDALRLICQRSGARIRRADCLASARRHLRTYRPGVVLVDVGLPDGSGLDLVADLARADPRVDAIFAMSGDDTLGPAAFDAGADAFLAKPIASVPAFQQLVLKHLPADAHPVGLGLLKPEMVVADRIALHDDLLRVARLLDDDPDRDTLGYAADFLSGIGKADGGEAAIDAGMELAALASAQSPDPARLARLSERIAQLLDDMGGV